MTVMTNPNHVGEVHFKINVNGIPVEMTLRGSQKVNLLLSFNKKDIAASQDLKNLLQKRILVKVG